MTDIKGDIGIKTIIVGYFRTPLTPMDRPSMQITEKKAVLNDTLNR